MNKHNKKEFFFMFINKFHMNLYFLLLMMMMMNIIYKILYVYVCVCVCAHCGLNFYISI